jgi:hypothetical protein
MAIPSNPALPLNLLFNSGSVSLQTRVGPFVRSFNFLLESGTHGWVLFKSRSLQNLNCLKTWTTFPLLYTNFTTLDPDHSIHVLFNPQFFLNPKLGLKLLFHLNHFTCNLTSQKKLLNFLFPLQHFSHLPERIKLAKSHCISHSLWVLALIIFKLNINLQKKYKKAQKNLSKKKEKLDNL